MKKTISSYVVKEITVPFLLGMGVFTFVLLMGRFLKLADLVVAKGVPIWDILRMLLYIFPSFSLVTIPMAFLMAVLLAFGRLSADSEITAMKSCGISLTGLLPSVMAFATIAYLATTFIAVYALPWGNTSFKKLLFDIMETRASLTLRPQVFNDDFPGMVIYVDRYRPEKHQISGILIQDERDAEEPSTIFAQTGTIVSDPISRSIRLQLRDGGIHRTLGSAGYRLIQFSAYDLNINLNQGTKGIKRDELDMSLGELQHSMNDKALPIHDQRLLALELHKRFSLPFACFVFALVGMPLGLQNQRSGKAGGFSISIGILLIYYVVLTSGKTLGEKGMLPPFLAVWAPNLLFLALGLYLFKKSSAEERVPLVLFIQKATELVQRMLYRRRRRK